MRALVVTRPGGPEVLEVQDLPEPVPDSQQVLVDVKASGVNFIDVYQRQGIYHIPTPFVVGLEGAGVVRETGQRVAWKWASGSAATVAAVSKAELVPLPDEVDFTTGAALMLQGMTAHFLANSTYPVRAGDKTLVHAAAGGVGQLLVQLLHRKDAEVIATAGSPEKIEIALRLGADHAIDYTQTPDLGAAIRAASDEQGVQVAYDGVGKATFEASLTSLAPRGLLALFGASSGAVPPLDLQRLNSGGSLYVTRPSLNWYTQTRSELLWRGEEMLHLVGEGQVKMNVWKTFPLTEAAQAYAALEERHSNGKIVLLP